jgi:hypothetical protein
MFSVAFAIFFFGPPLLDQPFGPYPLMKAGDALDLLTPLALLPLYWLLWRLGCSNTAVGRESLTFVFLAARG